jgi:hypothetical protein
MQNGEAPYNISGLLYERLEPTSMHTSPGVSSLLLSIDPACFVLAQNSYSPINKQAYLILSERLSPTLLCSAVSHPCSKDARWVH